jgi:hypothetical protein
VISFLHSKSQYKIADLSYIFEAGEFKYFGSHAHIILQASATISPLGFLIGNIILEINLSFFVFKSKNTFVSAISSSSYHFSFK